MIHAADGAFGWYRGEGDGNGGGGMDGGWRLGGEVEGVRLGLWDGFLSFEASSLRSGCLCAAFWFGGGWRVRGFAAGIDGLVDG